jgi:hypothetical protein
VSHAFLLGAGFSMAISPSMPSTNDLGRQVIETQRSIHSSRIAQHSNICDGLSCDAPVLPPGGVSNLNFEQWLTSIAEPQPYLYAPQNARRDAIFRELSGLVALKINDASRNATRGQVPDWLTKLVRYWHDHESSVITFNYDTLVEAAVEQAAIPVDGGDLNHRLVGPALLPWWNGPRSHPTDPTFRYSKLHGSTDWYWDDVTRAADSMVEIGFQHGWGEQTPRYTDEERRSRAPGKAPVIVPPTTAKSEYFKNPLIRELWHGAYLSLTAARRVFVIGYSLPDGDNLVRTLLAETIRDSEVWVVNIDPDVASRFNSLGVGDVRVDFANPDLRLEEFVRGLDT